MKYNWVIYWFWLQIKTTLRTAFQTITLGAYHTNLTLWKLKQAINIPIHSRHHYLFALKSTYLTKVFIYIIKCIYLQKNLVKGKETEQEQTWISGESTQLLSQKEQDRLGAVWGEEGFIASRWVWRRAVPWKTRWRGMGRRFPEGLWKVQMNCKAHFFTFPKRWGMKSSSQLQRKALSSLALRTKKKRKGSPWQGVIWSTWSKRLFLCQSVLLQILTLPPYASADQSSAFQNLCRDGFPAPCRRAEGSEQEGDKPGHSQLLLCVGRFVSVLKPERLSWCTATSGFCKMPFFITRSLQRAATSQPVRLCGGRTTRAASLIDEQR